MPASRIHKRLAAIVAVAVGLAGLSPQWAAGQGLPQECKALWASLEAAAKAKDLKAAAAGEREIAIDPICNAPLSVAAKEVMLGLYREEEARPAVAVEERLGDDGDDQDRHQRREDERPSVAHEDAQVPQENRQHGAR